MVELDGLILRFAGTSNTNAAAQVPLSSGADTSVRLMIIIIDTFACSGVPPRA
jgi:hypothetical protein